MQQDGTFDNIVPTHAEEIETINPELRETNNTEDVVQNNQEQNENNVDTEAVPPVTVVQNDEQDDSTGYFFETRWLQIIEINDFGRNFGFTVRF